MPIEILTPFATERIPPAHSGARFKKFPRRFPEALCVRWRIGELLLNLCNRLVRLISIEFHKSLTSFFSFPVHRQRIRFPFQPFAYARHSWLDYAHVRYDALRPCDAYV